MTERSSRRLSVETFWKKFRYVFVEENNLHLLLGLFYKLILVYSAIPILDRKSNFSITLLLYKFRAFDIDSDKINEVVVMEKYKF